MDLFPSGSFVRLRSRARGKYVHADKDGIHVSLRSLGAVPSPNAAWKVDLRPVEGEGGVGNRRRLLLQGAAYGRYLAVAREDDEVPPSGHRGVRAVQRDDTSRGLDPSFVWTPERVEAGRNYVRLHNDDQRRCLRANGRYRRWNNLVTVDVRNGDETAMMQWRVEAIPSTLEPQPLPPPPQPPIHVRRGLFRRRTGHDVHPHPGRTIPQVRLDDDESFVTDHWHKFVSYDNSVSNMRTQVARTEGDENIKFGVQAGTNARGIPVVIDLPKM